MFNLCDDMLITTRTRALFLFHGALQRMLMPARHIHHLAHLGFRNLERKHTHHGHALFMHRQHDLERLRMVQPEKAFQHMHHKFHRREIIVQQQHFIKRWPLGLGPRFNRNTRVPVIRVTLVGHHGEGLGQIGWLRESGSNGLKATI